MSKKKAMQRDITDSAVFRAFLRNHRAALARLRMLRGYAGDPGHPNIIHIAVTDRCNLSCPFCLYRGDNKNYHIIDQKKAEALIRETGCPIVLISGGEPLIEGEILEATLDIVRVCRDLGRITGVLTNGITLEKVLDMNYPEFRPRSRFFFQISIDGLEETHNELRGQFNKIISNIRVAKDAGHLIYTNTVVSKSNINDLEEIVRFVSGLSDRVYLNPMVNSSNALSKEELKATGDFIVNHQYLKLGNSVTFGKFLRGEKVLKCMYHSLISVTPSGKIKSPCYCYGEGAEYFDSFGEYLNKVDEQRKLFENRRSEQCKDCYTHCLHEAHVYATGYWGEIVEQLKRPRSLYKKHIAPVFQTFSKKRF